MSYRLGIDVGSTTLKIILLEKDKILYKHYERHFSKVREITAQKLNELKKIVGGGQVTVSITGSAGLGIAQATGIEFVQEVFATTGLIKENYEQTDVAIELGGEDAKIIFLDGTVEERMNSTCAGGTGAFIDQMASLLDVTTDEIDKLSLNATAIYPIASRCGVFAKTDIQPLINQGAAKENIAASIYQAVVNQTITGLAQGRPIRGNVLFLGGPLTFLKGLRSAFVNTLTNINPIFPENGEYFAALGAALYGSRFTKTYKLTEIIDLLIDNAARGEFESAPPLFKNQSEYDEFEKRHSLACAKKIDSTSANLSSVYLGIDAGSTTTKMVLIDSDCKIIFSDYRSNKGNPLEIVKDQLMNLYTKYPEVKILSSAVTGYGEELIKSAFCVDKGIVETVAHYTAAKYFDDEVDFIIDIGGQDMKCFGIKDGMVDSVMLNEACSSGCGSFLETFASSLGYTIDEFAKIAIFAKKPVDLGSRCTVFMNSSVKQAQKNGADISDISAGLAISVVKNAIYKVLRVADARSLGKKIVVQGGTFLNDAVLRAFEQLIDSDVTRPDIAGLMGAFGAALIAVKSSRQCSGIMDKQSLIEFTHSSSYARCGLCQNRCSITINKFSNGNKYISGNRCEKPLKKGESRNIPNIYEFKRKYFENYSYFKGNEITIGLPFVLNFYDNLPFWFTVFKELGFSVLVSKPSNREIYRKGQHTIPSDTICYGAKLVHGHVLSLVESGVDAIFYPCMTYNYNEGISDNCYHCPVVAYYPEVINANVREINNVKFLYPYLALNDLNLLAKQLKNTLLSIGQDINETQIRKACKNAAEEQQKYRQAILNEGKRSILFAQQNKLKTIVLAGRPYHTDPEINHGIDGLISSLGFVVLSEDSIDTKEEINKHIKRQVLNQWSYHARMYTAADYVVKSKNTELVQLVSFGCGLDAVTSDEIKEILRSNGKLYTQLKIDEISNLGAVKIRLRSLLAAMNERGE